MKVTVDFNRCQSNAICMSIAPSVFEVREDGYLYILAEDPPDELKPLVIEAAEACPTQAISLQE